MPILDEEIKTAIYNSLHRDSDISTKQPVLTASETIIKSLQEIEKVCGRKSQNADKRILEIKNTVNQEILRDFPLHVLIINTRKTGLLVFIKTIKGDLLIDR